MVILMLLILIVGMAIVMVNVITGEQFSKLGSLLKFPR